MHLAEIFCLQQTKMSLKRKICLSFRTFSGFSTTIPCFTRYLDSST